jgi:hypothetical protein
MNLLDECFLLQDSLDRLLILSPDGSKADSQSFKVYAILHLEERHTLESTLKFEILDGMLISTSRVIIMVKTTQRQGGDDRRTS